MKKLLALLMTLCLLTLFGATALAQTIPSSVNPQQMGHPAYLESVYGKRKADQIIKDYGPPSTTHVPDPVDPWNRDGSLSKPFVYGVTSAYRFVPGCYFTSMGILCRMIEYTTYNGRAAMYAYVCNADGTPASYDRMLFQLI